MTETKRTALLLAGLIAVAGAVFLPGIGWGLP